MTRPVFSPTESRAIVHTAPTDWWRAFVLVGLRAGLRVTEAIRLMPQDVNQNDLCVTVRTRLGAPWECEGEIFPTFDSPWQGVRKRHVSTDRETVEALKRLSHGNASPYIFVPACRLAKLWPFIDDGIIPGPEQLAPGLSFRFAQLQRIAQCRLGDCANGGGRHVPWRVRPLCALRHTFASQLAEQVSPGALAAILGLASPREALPYFDRNVASEMAKTDSRD